LRGASSGNVSVACNGTLDSGRWLKTESGSPGSPRSDGKVIARLALAAACGLALNGRTAWYTT
jgi:hypothetical protein